MKSSKHLPVQSQNQDKVTKGEIRLQLTMKTPTQTLKTRSYPPFNFAVTKFVLQYVQQKMEQERTTYCFNYPLG